MSLHLDHYLEMLRSVSTELKAWELRDDQIELMARIGALLLAGQERASLTAIRTSDGVARAHIADSLMLWKLKPEWLANSDCVDIGTGGGFPLLPLAGIESTSRWTGIESVGKKARHVADCADMLGLANVKMENSRAEVTARSDMRAAADLVVARAVGPVVSLVELGLPHLRIGGRVVLYKTEQAMLELRDCAGTIERLGGTATPEILRYRFDDDVQDRLLIVIEKVAETPEEYPRTDGLPFNKPLRG